MKFDVPLFIAVVVSGVALRSLVSQARLGRAEDAKVVDQQVRDAQRFPFPVNF